MIMGLFLLTWHYAACSVLLGVCWFARSKDKLRICVLCDVLMLIVSIVGFYFMFQIFEESGKTFAMYVQRYGGYAFGVFLFPVIGFLMTMGCSGDKL